MRTELELRYGGENITIKSVDDKIIDCMYLKAESEDSEQPGESELGPTVVICNPNGDYYEYAIDTQDHWIEFYRKNGINILLWNYRGYNRSQGSPNPINTLSDGESVVNYLKDVKGTGRVLIHGQSLGGAVASHIASKLGCDFLFVDRSFSSLDMITEVIAGRLAARIVRFIIDWHFDTTEAFLSAQCYKIVGNDPNDVIISEISSLKNGIAEKIIMENKIYGRFALTDNEIYIFYKNLSDLYEMIQDFDEVPKKHIKRRKSKRRKSDDMCISCTVRIRTLSDGEIKQDNFMNKVTIGSRANTCISENEYIISAEYNPPEKYSKFMKLNDKEEAGSVLNILNKTKEEIDKLDSAG